LGASFKYNQKFSNRWTGIVDVTYENSAYSNFDEQTTEDRDDDLFNVRPSIQYLFREWLMFELAYKYETRDSTDDLYDYTSNTIIFNANLAF
jgi:uncharacterized protein (PEP-CTERM system associated)